MTSPRLVDKLERQGDPNPQYLPQESKPGDGSTNPYFGSCYRSVRSLEQPLVGAGLAGGVGSLVFIRRGFLMGGRQGVVTALMGCFMSLSAASSSAFSYYGHRRQREFSTLNLILSIASGVAIMGAARAILSPRQFMTPTSIKNLYRSIAPFGFFISASAALATEVVMNADLMPSEFNLRPC